MNVTVKGAVLLCLILHAASSAAFLPTANVGSLCRQHAWKQFYRNTETQYNTKLDLFVTEKSLRQIIKAELKDELKPIKRDLNILKGLVTVVLFTASISAVGSMSPDKFFQLKHSALAFIRAHVAFVIAFFVGYFCDQYIGTKSNSED